MIPDTCTKLFAQKVKKNHMIDTRCPNKFQNLNEKVRILKSLSKSSSNRREITNFHEFFVFCDFQILSKFVTFRLKKREMIFFGTKNSSNWKFGPYATNDIFLKIVKKMVKLKGCQQISRIFRHFVIFNFGRFFFLQKFVRLKISIFSFFVKIRQIEEDLHRLLRMSTKFHEFFVTF